MLEQGKTYEREKAELCIAAGMQPSEYDALTDAERTAFIEVINERAERK